jgi:cytochrome c-type biogenesis protein CcmH
MRSEQAREEDLEMRRTALRRVPARQITLAVVLLPVFLSVPGPAFAVQPDEVLKDQTLETRARALSRELRCMVCQNQSIDDSDADLARDLRILVRERLTAGDSDAEVRDFLVARYGEFVLLRPRITGPNAVLWVTPVAVLLAGAFAMFAALRRRRDAPAPTPLTAEEEQRLAKVIDEAS